MPRLVNPGHAKLPSNVHLQAQEQCGSGVNYYAEIADDYEKGRQTGQRRLGPALVDNTSQTSSKEAVLLVGMRVVDVRRKAPPTTGIAVKNGGCGAGVDSGQGDAAFCTCLTRERAHGVDAVPAPRGRQTLLLERVQFPHLCREPPHAQ
ncbi:hypothetical protein [Streptomyces sp. NPDC051452]|uniref:hypothetical protein n=1 Tax=Streptomyces sp. NPDC051452 TaxID=3365654 RepID=UPI0037952F18